MEASASVTNYMLAAGERTAREPCLIASNLSFTSLQKSHRDSLQVMTSGVCVVRRDYIHPGHFVLLPHAEPTLMPSADADLLWRAAVAGLFSADVQVALNCATWFERVRARSSSVSSPSARYSKSVHCR